jgi:two-component system phosphate regulon response regulator OmpR
MPEPEAEECAPKIVQMGAVRHDIERAELSHGDTPIRLTATEVQLMRIFAEHLRKPVSRNKLVEDLGRDGGQAQERAVDVQITRLRRKIESDPKQPRYLQTVRGEGYMLAPD